MTSRSRSYLHIFSPQQHHLSLADVGAKQLPMALEIPEYVCPLQICDNNLTLQSLHQSEPCISLTSEEGDTYLFDGIITDQTVYRAMNNEYLYEEIIPPNPVEQLETIARDIVSAASTGLSQLVVSAGPVGSGHGTIAFSCSHSSLIADTISNSRMQADQRQVTHSVYDYQGSSQTVNVSQLITSCIDDISKQASSLQQHIQSEAITREAESIRCESSSAPQGLLWQILKHISSAISNEDIEWPKIACFTLDSGQQVIDLLDYPGVTEAYGMGAHLDMKAVEYTDCPDKSVEYQMYIEKFGDRAQAFEGTAFGNIQDAATAFLASGIVQQAAKNLNLPFRKAMSMSQHSNPLRSDAVSGSNTFASGATTERRTGTSGTLHLQSLYPDDLPDLSGRTKSHTSELSFEARAYLKAADQSNSKKMRPISTLSTKAFTKALSKSSPITLKTHQGLVTPECVGKSSLKILNINPSTLLLLKRSLIDRRRPICTWEELKTVSDGTIQHRGSTLGLPCLMNIRKQKGLPNYLLAMDSCAPTVVSIYLGPSRAYSCILFIDICTCTTQTPLQQFSLSPQFKTSLESLAALKSLVDNVSVEKQSLLQAKTYTLTRLILGHLPNLARSSKEIKRSSQHTPSNQSTHPQCNCRPTQKIPSQNILKEGSAALESMDIDLNLNTITEHDMLSDALDDERIHGSTLQQLSDSTSIGLQEVTHVLHDITFIHSVQICETDAKNTLQQLRLASSLDRKVEMGFYWSTQLYNDSMRLARMGLLPKEGDCGLASVPLGCASIHYDSNSVSCVEKVYGLQSPLLIEDRTSNEVVRPVQSNMFNIMASVPKEIEADKRDHQAKTEPAFSSSSEMHPLDGLKPGNSNRFAEEHWYGQSTSPKQPNGIEGSPSSTHSPDNKTEKHDITSDKCSPAPHFLSNDSISSPPKEVTNSGVNTNMLLVRLRNYIDKAEAMRDRLDAKINVVDVKI